MSDPIKIERNRYLERVDQEGLSTTDILSSSRHGEITIPLTFLHPVFGTFVEDCQTIPLAAEDNYLAIDLAIAMSDIYGNVDERVRSVSRVLTRYGISLDFRRNNSNTKYIVNASISVYEHPCVIAEFRNEMASGDAAIHCKGITHFVESTRRHALEYTRSPLPCMVLAIFGSYMCFAGATWNLQPMAQILSTPIAFQFHSTDTHNRDLVTRHIAAWRKAINTLQQYYKTLELTEENLRQITPAPRQIFPHKTSYTSFQGHGTIHFQYTKEMIKSKSAFVFLGATSDQAEPIWIRFSRSYSPDAHAYLASLGHAPVMRGLERIPGGWFMSVFDALDGFETLADRKQPLPLSVFDAISATLSEFHEAGFVHGDLRDANVMVSDSETGETKFMIVGFDWAGRTGEVQYPWGVNSEGVVRPEAELCGKAILAAHDMFMLDHLRGSQSKE